MPRDAAGGSEGLAGGWLVAEDEEEGGRGA